MQKRVLQNRRHKHKQSFLTIGFWTVLLHSEIKYKFLRKLNFAKIWRVAKNRKTDFLSTPRQVEVFNRRVVFETVLSENWFNGYIAVDSITHADGGEGGCETLPRAAEVSTVPPETTTTPGLWFF